MKSTCIAHPPRESLIVIHAWQRKFCDGSATAAALMSFFEYWHNIKLDMQQKAIELNKVAERHGEVGEQDTTLWQHHTNEELIEGIQGIGKKDAVRDAVAFLEGRGVIEVGSNPVARYRFDRTRFYRFHPEVVNAWLAGAYPLAENRLSNVEKSPMGDDGVELAPPIGGKPSMELRETVTATAENRQAITETSSEISSKNDPDDLDAAHAAVFLAWEEQIKTSITKKLRSELGGLIVEVGAEWALRGIAIGADNGKSHFSYIAACARNARAEAAAPAAKAPKAPRQESYDPGLLPVIVPALAAPAPRPTPPAPVGVWGQVLAELKQQMPVATFDSWVAGCFVLEEGADRWRIGVPNRYGLDWLEQRLKNTIQRTLGSIVGHRVAVSFELAQGAA